ncbi:matrixin family metalloprotease [Peptoniphilus sp. KCTC 25270]|uniref:matrixin family metalloprotease n=1 Tax=Peptoniphilus sp. KCTC 25270 TaxID=2897414 RepID=UPI001E64D68C|nr:matrixin family metalloprotease [Peptoniphilus sp. KCTC 25270]MCD1147124.1 matrixin family metalloprotease [Peptoniphilus sp. KCTC 25270]
MLLGSLGYAYSLNGRKISTTVTYVPHNLFGSLTKSHFNNALYEWNSGSGRNLMQVSQNTHTKMNFPSRDSQNCIYRKSVSDSYVALNKSYFNSRGVILESDINFNMNKNFANSAQDNAFDVWTVMLHEAGHTAGLDHSSNSSAVMWHTVSKNSTKRFLHSDDRNGLKAIY